MRHDNMISLWLLVPTTVDVALSSVTGDHRKDGARRIYFKKIMKDGSIKLNNK